MLAAVLATASILAGGSLAGPMLTRGEGDVVRSVSSHAVGSQGAGAAGNQNGALGGGESSSANQDSSAKKGKGYCGEENDGDVSKCPSAPKKSAKKGKGYAAG